MARAFPRLARSPPPHTGRMATSGPAQPLRPVGPTLRPPVSPPVRPAPSIQAMPGPAAGSRQSPRSRPAMPQPLLFHVKPNAPQWRRRRACSQARHPHLSQRRGQGRGQDKPQDLPTRPGIPSHTPRGLGTTRRWADPRPVGMSTNTTTAWCHARRQNPPGASTTMCTPKRQGQWSATATLGTSMLASLPRPRCTHAAPKRFIGARCLRALVLARPQRASQLMPQWVGTPSTVPSPSTPCITLAHAQRPLHEARGGVPARISLRHAPE